MNGRQNETPEERAARREATRNVKHIDLRQEAIDALTKRVAELEKERGEFLQAAVAAREEAALQRVELADVRETLEVVSARADRERGQYMREGNALQRERDDALQQLDNITVERDTALQQCASGAAEQARLRERVAQAAGELSNAAADSASKGEDGEACAYHRAMDLVYAALATPSAQEKP
jgi:hypothetical protein